MFKNPSRKKLFVSLCSFLGLALFFAMATWYYSLNPQGVYYDKDISSGYAYWIFKDGIIYFKTPETNSAINTYKNSVGVWYCENHLTKRLVILKPSLIGITTIDFETGRTDRFMPRYGFSWLYSIFDAGAKHKSVTEELYAPTNN